GAEGGPSILVCLDLDTGREGWAVKAPPGGPNERSFFEGAPLVHDGRAYAALSTLSGTRTKTVLVCYDAEAGAPRWRRAAGGCPRGACAVPLAEGEGLRRRHPLLTLAGGVVVYCSHSGAVVALDGLTGKRLWGVRSPSRGPAAEGTPPPRDLAPCVAVDHRL